MRILGVHPGPLMYSKVFLRLEPLGLELVAAAALRAGHDVRLIDLQVHTHPHFCRLLESWRPDAIVFSCNYLANVPEIIDLAKLAKRLIPQSFICVLARRSLPKLFSRMVAVPSIACSGAKAKPESRRCSSRFAVTRPQ
jgi:hypothetical protein